MKQLDVSRKKVMIQISILMLIFLIASSFANAVQDRYEFVILYIFGFVVTLGNLIWYAKKNQDDKMAQHIVTILFFLFFSFFFIGEQKTFDVLWVLILPVVTIIVADYHKTRVWLATFVIMLFCTIILQTLYPEIIRYESFALWSILWAGIFFSGMVIYYKMIQQKLQEEIVKYQNGLEDKVVQSVSEIKSLRTQKEEIDYKLLQSRLGSLEMQLNPHFLFNALNSIAELIHQDTEKAERAIIKVSSFLRNTMNEETLISLKNELENVNAYIQVENIRFDNKITITTPRVFPNWMVPKFSIQLLVENAIKHGIMPDERALNIYIFCKEDEKTIVIENDGRPMDDIKFGVGLNNLNQRLDLLCKGHLEVEGGARPRFYIRIGACDENTDRR